MKDLDHKLLLHDLASRDVFPWPKTLMEVFDSNFTAKSRMSGLLKEKKARKTLQMGWNQRVFNDDGWAMDPFKDQRKRQQRRRKLERCRRKKQRRRRKHQEEIQKKQTLQLTKQLQVKMRSDLKTIRGEMIAKQRKVTEAKKQHTRSILRARRAAQRSAATAEKEMLDSIQHVQEIKALAVKIPGAATRIQACWRKYHKSLR